MTKTKIPWRRRLPVYLCAILIFCTALPVTAHADNVTINSGTSFAYFQTFSSRGVWTDIMTPTHYVEGTGQVAYCLQTEKESPYGSSYSSTDGSAYYSAYIRNGLQAILENGYPANNGGYSDAEARYATANAIRFFLAENGVEGVPGWMNLKTSGEFFRGKYGYEGLFDWCYSLLVAARNGSGSASRSISFSNSNLTLESVDDHFEGTVRVNLTNCNNGYTLNTSNLPSGSRVTGYTGGNGDTLKITIPDDYELSSYSLSATGSGTSSGAVLYYYAPSVYNQQRMVVSTVETKTSSVSASMTVRTPEAPNYGYLAITKRDAETNALMPNIGFRVYDAANNLVASGYTDSNGRYQTGKLPHGDYYYQEFSTVKGYYLNENKYPFTLNVRRQVLELTCYNDPRKGTITVRKCDPAGNMLSGVTFVLETSTNGGASWSYVAELTTNDSGTGVFAELPADSVRLYRVTECSAASGDSMQAGRIFLGTLPIQFSPAEANDGKEYELINGSAYLYDVNLTVCNTDIYALPFTGGNGFAPILFIALMLTGMGIFILIYSKKKEITE